MKEPTQGPKPDEHGGFYYGIRVVGMICAVMLGLGVLIVALAACPLMLPVFGGIGLLLPLPVVGMAVGKNKQGFESCQTSPSTVRGVEGTLS